MSVLNAFTVQQQALLQRLVAAIIPASETLNLPSADDQTIFTAFLKGAGGDQDAADSLIEQLADFFKPFGGIETVAELDDGAFDQVIDTAKQNYHELLETLIPQLSLAYYRDSRVIISLNKEDRPPFPKGNIVVQGDWSLLNAVKQRQPLYRKC